MALRITRSSSIAKSLEDYKYEDGNDNARETKGETSTRKATVMSRKRTGDPHSKLQASASPSPSSRIVGSELDSLSATASLPSREAKYRKLSVMSENGSSVTSHDDSASDAAISTASSSSNSSSSIKSASKSTRRETTSTAVAKREGTITTAKTKSAMTVTTTTSNKSSAYADPSKYAHLKELTDIVEPNLIGIFVGFNPGIATATAGHAYAHPSNRFWKLLHVSGITDRLCRPVHDQHLPRLYQMGNTNIVGRPSKDIAELAEGEMAAGTPALEGKVRRFKPESVCIVGKAIWEGIWRHRYGRNIKKEEFRYGWQDERHNMGIGGVEDGGSDHGDENADKDGDAGKSERASPWKGARVFVATSTSGLSTIPTYPQKVEIWKDYGDWVKERRAARAKENENTPE